MNGMSRILRVCIAAPSLAALASCTSLPDTSGFTVATAQLGSSVRLTGDILEAELDRGIAALPAEHQTEALAQKSKDFTDAWGVTVKSLDAMSRYAESVESLTMAGNSGEANAQALATSVELLVDAIGLPMSEVGGVGLGAAARLYGEIAKVRAARSLTKSLEAADPIIQSSMAKLSQQTSTAEGLFRVLINEQRLRLDAQYEHEKNAQDALDELAVEVANAAAAGSNAGTEGKATRVRIGRESIAARMAEYRDAVTALDERERRGVALFSSTRAAIETWSGSHMMLLTAIRERRPVSIQSLLAASDDVRTLITRWRDL